MCLLGRRHRPARSITCDDARAQRMRPGGLASTATTQIRRTAERQTGGQRAGFQDRLPIADPFSHDYYYCGALRTPNRRRMQGRAVHAPLA